MKITMYYETEIRSIEADPSIIVLTYENGDNINKFSRKKCIDMSNAFVSTKGLILKELQPLTDKIGTLQKIEIHEQNILIDTIIGAKNPMYRFGTPNPKQLNPDLQVPQLQESFQVDL
jgi:hypothetical protein